MLLKQLWNDIKVLLTSPCGGYFSVGKDSPIKIEYK